MNLENITFNEISQVGTEKHIYFLAQSKTQKSQKYRAEWWLPRTGKWRKYETQVQEYKGSVIG